MVGSIPRKITSTSSTSFDDTSSTRSDETNGTRNNGTSTQNRESARLALDRNLGTRVTDQDSADDAMPNNMEALNAPRNNGRGGRNFLGDLRNRIARMLQRWTARSPTPVRSNVEPEFEEVIQVEESLEDRESIPGAQDLIYSEGNRVHGRGGVHPFVELIRHYDTPTTEMLPESNQLLTRDLLDAAQIPEAQILEAQIPEAQIPEAQIPEAQIPEALALDSNSHESIALAEIVSDPTPISPEQRETENEDTSLERTTTTPELVNVDDDEEFMTNLPAAPTHPVDIQGQGEEEPLLEGE
ncbi:hypothetical protein [Marinibactrum halimedae]|uniref:Uncharacterized protein n=1 Tax=Marinibactrum halimedae TaxID=1444977 RepID=A0AA37T280_9GAMM|nr:hypothetical protein [Marinibactrum halimedae]MCD9459083.1 hypothetical protein [Marinibactrum halimedae]GLS24684.1 hypothetical protein GCM10007877_03980 [Marinibactrum halimedae]